MLEEQHVPAASLLRVALAQRAEEAGTVRNGEGDDLSHALRREQRAEVGRRGTPVVTDDDGVLGTKRLEQRGDVLAERHRVEASVGGLGRGGVAPHERRHDPVSRFDQRRHLVAPAARVIGEAVQAEDEWTGAGLEGVERHVGRRDRAWGHRASVAHGASEGGAVRGHRAFILTDQVGQLYTTSACRAGRRSIASTSSSTSRQPSSSSAATAARRWPTWRPPWAWRKGRSTSPWRARRRSSTSWCGSPTGRGRSPRSRCRFRRRSPARRCAWYATSWSDSRRLLRSPRRWNARG